MVNSENIPRKGPILLQFEKCSNSSSCSNLEEEVLLGGESRVAPFVEYFFEVLPLVVHPIIILRLLCHKMFGSMLRRKTAQQPSSPTTNTLTAPTFVETESFPLWSGRDIDATSSDSKPVTTSHLSTKKRSDTLRKSNVHIQIATPLKPKLEEDDEFHLRRRRTRRAGSMDKHLLHLGSAKRRSINSAMSLAIKSIGDSLLQPIDLNISPPAASGDAYALDSKRRMLFQFPSLQKRSKSQGYITRIGDSTESILFSHRSSTLSILKPAELELKEFQRELINLPVFEMDMGGVNDGASISVSRFSSVPEQLEFLQEHNMKEPQLDAKDLSSLQKHHATQVRKKAPKLSSMNMQKNVNESCVRIGSLPTHTSKQRKHLEPSGEHTILWVKGSNFHGAENASRKITEGLQKGTCVDSENAPEGGSTLRPLPTEAILFHFAAATPCESPGSITEMLESPQEKSENKLPTSSADTVPSSTTHALNLPVKSMTVTTSASELLTSSSPETNSLVPRPSSLWSPSKSIERLSLTFSHTSLSAQNCTLGISSASCEQHSPNFSLVLPSPGHDIPVNHKSIMDLFQAWIQICSSDLECCIAMKNETKDFLNKMSSLGTDYRTWSYQMRDKLKLEVSCTFSECLVWKYGNLFFI